MSKEFWMKILELIIFGLFIFGSMEFGMFLQRIKINQTIKIENHRLETWVTALEWCESAGIKEAINPRDHDNTPSYYSFQWKPSTFKIYAERYQLVPQGTSDTQFGLLMKDYELQRTIVKSMVEDSKVNWDKEFPVCIKKVGMPPIN